MNPDRLIVSIEFLQALRSAGLELTSDGELREAPRSLMDGRQHRGPRETRVIAAYRAAGFPAEHADRDSPRAQHRLFWSDVLRAAFLDWLELRTFQSTVKQWG